MSSEVNISDFMFNNKIFKNYDSLQSIFINDLKCLEYLSSDSIFIIPNPIKSEFYIYSKFINYTAKSIDYEIYSTEGRRVDVGKAKFLKDKIYFSNVPDSLSKGVYFFKIYYENKVYSVKTVID